MVKCSVCFTSPAAPVPGAGTQFQQHRPPAAWASGERGGAHDCPDPSGARGHHRPWGNPPQCRCSGVATAENSRHRLKGTIFKGSLHSNLNTLQPHWTHRPVLVTCNVLTSRPGGTSGAAPTVRQQPPTLTATLP